MGTPQFKNKTHLDFVINVIRHELKFAQKTFPPFNSMHEGYAIVQEELDEAWTNIKATDPAKSTMEMIQVATTALRFILDVGCMAGIERQWEIRE